MEKYKELLKRLDKLAIPKVTGNIPHGDMPGDKVEIQEGHIKKANIIFEKLGQELHEFVSQNKSSRVVLTVCGGSGVGKSEVASLLTYYFRQNGIGSYTLSGDNYPRRIPRYNDAERLRIFRESAVRGLVEAELFTRERFEKLRQWQNLGEDADSKYVKEEPWFEVYLEKGRKGLEDYLGTDKEINFDEIGNIVKQFKAGKDEIWLRRMGREETDLWYEKVDFSSTDILIIEWTHGNSGNYQGVDIPILLNSTPRETLEHRRARNRDGKTDSPFTMLVLAIEQKKLEEQAPKARIIVSKSGSILSYEEYLKVMEESRNE